MYMYINIKVREKLKLLICELLKIFSKKNYNLNCVLVCI